MGDVGYGLFPGLFSGGQGIFNAQNQMITNRQNEALLRESWARDDTAVQRRTADLEAAGINPLMAAGQAAGNSGSPLRLEAPEMKTNPGKDALQGAMTAQNIAQSQAQTDLTRAQARKADAEADVMTKEFTDDYGRPYSWIEAQATKVLGDVYEQRNRVRSGEGKEFYDAGFKEEFLANKKRAFMEEHQDELMELDLKLRREGYSQSEIRTRISKIMERMALVDEKWQKPDKWIGAGARLIGAASAGARGVTGAMLDYAKYMTPSEY